MSPVMHSRVAEMAAATSCSLSAVITELIEKAMASEPQSAGPPVSDANLADIRRECQHIDAALADVRRQLSMLVIRSRAFPSFSLDDTEVDPADSITWLFDDPEHVDDVSCSDETGTPVDATHSGPEREVGEPSSTVDRCEFRGWPPPDAVRERELGEILSRFYD